MSRSATQAVESLTKLTAFAVGSLYLCRSLVVMLHLSHYGMSLATVFRLRYLISGFRVLVPLFLACMGAALWRAWLGDFHFASRPEGAEATMQFDRDAVAGYAVLRPK